MCLKFRTKLESFQELFERTEIDLDFKKNIITYDKTWIYEYDVLKQSGNRKSAIQKLYQNQK